MVDKRKFKDTKVSLLGLGTMRLPCLTSQKRESNPDIDYESGQKLVDLAYQNGVNYFDTAYMYHCGKSEKSNCREIEKCDKTRIEGKGRTDIWICLSGLF